MEDLKTIGEERKEWENLVFNRAQELLHIIEKDPFQFNGDNEYKSITLYPDYENNMLTVNIQKNEIEFTTLTRKINNYESPKAEVVYFDDTDRCQMTSI